MGTTTGHYVYGTGTGRNVLRFATRLYNSIGVTYYIFVGGLRIGRILINLMMFTTRKGTLRVTSLMSVNVILTRRSILRIIELRRNRSLDLNLYLFYSLLYSHLDLYVRFLINLRLLVILGAQVSRQDMDRLIIRLLSRFFPVREDATTNRSYRYRGTDRHGDRRLFRRFRGHVLRGDFTLRPSR